MSKLWCWSFKWEFNPLIACAICRVSVFKALKPSFDFFGGDTVFKVLTEKNWWNLDTGSCHGPISSKTLLHPSFLFTLTICLDLHVNLCLTRLVIYRAHTIEGSNGSKACIITYKPKRISKVTAVDRKC